MAFLTACGGAAQSTTTTSTVSAASAVPGTLAAETANNTSAASGYDQTSTGNAAPGNVSKLPTASLLYPGATTKVYAQLQGWFGGTNHINVGYASNDPAQVARQVNDAISRGISGFILDWYGATYDPRTDETARLLKAEAERHPGFTFAIQEDAGALRQCAQSSCDVTGLLISDLTYAYNTYEQSPAYMKQNGRPLVFLFDVNMPNIDWARVRTSVPGNPMLVERSQPGSDEFAASHVDGAYGWPTLNGDPNNWGQDYIWTMYTQGKASGKYTLGVAYKGFNDGLALWGQHRVISQQCGGVWLNTFAQVANSYSPALQLDNIQIATWNDYEEGTEIETGLDNCLGVNASVAGGTLSFSATGAGDETRTVDHYTVFVSADGANLTKIADLPLGTRSLDLAALRLNPGTYTVYVKMQSKAGLLNKMSNGVQYAR